MRFVVRDTLQARAGVTMLALWSCDDDRSGTFSRLEFRKAVMSMGRPFEAAFERYHHLCDELFESIDQDGSGEISLEEIDQFLHVGCRARLNRLGASSLLRTAKGSLTLTTPPRGGTLCTSEASPHVGILHSSGRHSVSVPARRPPKVTSPRDLPPPHQMPRTSSPEPERAQSFRSPRSRRLLESANSVDHTQERSQSFRSRPIEHGHSPSMRRPSTEHGHSPSMRRPPTEHGHSPSMRRPPSKWGEWAEADMPSTAQPRSKEAVSLPLLRPPPPASVVAMLTMRDEQTRQLMGKGSISSPRHCPPERSVGAMLKMKDAQAKQLMEMGISSLSCRPRTREEEEEERDGFKDGVPLWYVSTHVQLGTSKYHKARGR